MNIVYNDSSQFYFKKLVCKSGKSFLKNNPLLWNPNNGKHSHKLLAHLCHIQLPRMSGQQHAIVLFLTGKPKNKKVNKQLMVDHKWYNVNTHTSGAPPAPSHLSFPSSPPAQMSPGWSLKLDLLSGGEALINRLLHSVLSGNIGISTFCWTKDRVSDPGFLP